MQYIHCSNNMIANGSMNSVKSKDAKYFQFLELGMLKCCNSKISILNLQFLKIAEKRMLKCRHYYAIYAI